MPIGAYMGWDCLAYKSYWFSVRCKVGSHNRK